MEYEELLELPRPISHTRAPMPLCDRAAQFAPFAALSGHADAVEETAEAVEKAFQP